MKALLLPQILAAILGIFLSTGFGSPYKVPKIQTENITPPGYLSQAMISPSNIQHSPWPEHFIDPTLNYGLSLVLPQSIRKGLEFGAGYDRWEGLPTVNADYFLPIKGWSDKSVFFSPRVSLTGTKESFSVGAGFRHLLTSEALVGFHAFHDWVRPRRSKGEFLKEAGVGLEVSALPGYYSDINFRVNAYFPINERRTLDRDSTMILEEVLPRGGDARVGILLPTLSPWLDIRLDASAHSYRAENTDITGYRVGMSLSSRNGMFTANLEQGKDSMGGENFRVDGGITLAFDWAELFKGAMPFSAPYSMSEVRYNRNIRDSLYVRVVRKHNLPADRSERPIALAAVVSGDTVSFRGSFPDLSNSKVTVQVSHSPWQDYGEVITNSKGSYQGRLRLPPGKCRIRLIHKPTGCVSEARIIMIGSSDRIE
ncbi:MAG: hypothetical protein WCJ75_00960 [Desulfomonile sp.]